MKMRGLTSLLLAVVLLALMIVPVYAEDTTPTVESVTAQLEAIDTLQQMQNKRSSYTASGHYDYTTTNQTYIDSHLATQSAYATYITNMFAARTAAQQAYDSLTPEEQAQISPALVAKLSNELPSTFLGGTYPVTPREDEYVFEAVKGPLGMAYEVSTSMVAGEIPQTFVVVDTSDGKTQWTPDGPYVDGESNYHVTYCCDINTGLEWGTDYRRINLEDSPYFGAEAAAHVRAIVMNAYPFVTLEEMKANLKAGGLNAAYVDSLTRGDIIAAVQMAIWSYAYDEVFSHVNAGYFATIGVKPNIGIYFTPLHDYTNEIWDWLPKARQRTFNAAAEYRVNNLVYYLCNLDGVAPAEDQITISEVQVGRLDLVPRTEDMYSVGLHVLLNRGCDVDDNVTLRITSYSEDAEGNVIKTSTNTVQVGEKKEYALTINAKYGDTIEVTAEGTQVLDRGVYFYEAEGGPKVSQSLVGVSGGENPVYATQTFTFEEDVEMGLRIYKKSTVDKAPISDITFDVYKVEPEEGEKLNEIPTPQEIARYAVAENLVGTLVTDKTGYAALELTEKGTYLVVERHNAEKVEKPADPFYIMLPWPVEKEIEGENGIETVIEYTDIVSVYPKNTPTVPPPPPPPPPPEEVVGQFNIIKHDTNDQTDVLAGAEFHVYRAATDADTETETLQYGTLTCAVVPVLVDGEPLVLTTDDKGSALSPELPVGVYYIKETKAPTGYVLPKEALTVTVVSKEVQKVTYCYVANDRGILLPETGGIGVTLFVTAGTLLTMLAVLFLVVKKRVAMH